MKDTLKYLIWGGIYAVLIIPLIVASGMFFPYITGKAFAFRIIIEIILGLWLILIIKDKEFRPKWSWVMGTVSIFTFILLIADLNAVAPYKAFWSNYERMEGLVTFLHLLAYFFVISSMLNTEKLWLWFLRANLVMGFIMAVTSISEGLRNNIVRFAGPLGNPIYISVYFMFIFFFTLIVMYKYVLVKNLIEWKMFKKVFANVLFYVYSIVAVLSLFVVYRTSRGALLGVIGGIFIGAILIAIFEKEKKVIKHLAISGVIAVILIVLTFLSVRSSSFVQNNSTLKRFAEISWSNVNGQARQLVWPMALKGFQEKPILGWGQEGFNYVFNKYYDPGMYGQEAWFDRAHNAPLDFLVAGGILGFLSYLSLFGGALYLLWFRKNVLSITERSLITGLLAGYLFQAIFVFDNLVSYIMFFTTLAYVHSHLVESKKMDPKSSKQQVPGYLSVFVQNEEYQNYILIPGVVILIALSFWFVNVPAMSANQTLIQALGLIQSGRAEDGLKSLKTALAYGSLGDSEIREQLLSYTPNIVKQAEIDQKTKQAFVELTYNEIQNQIDRVPADARYQILMGSFLNSVGNPMKALPYIKEAVALSPNKQAMRFELVQSLYALGKSAEAMSEAKSAYELDKRFEQAKTIYKATIENEMKVNPKFKVEGEKLLKELGE
jgi:O-antigen ligase/thioredoxin-like negative regulator of GroEL